MINWNGFERELVDYFSIIDFNRTINDSAIKLSSLYTKYVLQGSNIYGNRVISMNSLILKGAFIGCFNLNMASFKKLGVTPFILIANSIVGAWVGATLSPFPPVTPSITPAPIPSSCVVTFPGNIFPLAFNIWYALGNFIKTPKLSAKSFVMGCRLHLQTIQGIYFGLMPSLSGLIPSIPTPWVGIF